MKYLSVHVIFAVLLMLSNTTQAENGVAIDKIELDPTPASATEYKLIGTLKVFINDKSNTVIQGRWWIKDNGSGNVISLPDSLLTSSTEGYNIKIVTKVLKSYFINDCLTVVLSAFDVNTTNPNPQKVQTTVCRPIIVPKAMSGKWEWNNGLWVENPTLNVSKVKLGAFLKQDNGASWDYNTNRPLNTTLLEVQSKPHDATSANKPYIGEGSLMMTASELESYSAYLTLSSNKCRDYKVRISTTDGPTSNPAFTTKISPSPWRIFTAGSECSVPWDNKGSNKIQAGKWEWMSGNLEILPPVLHFFGKLSRDDGTLWDLKTAKPKNTRVEVHSRPHTISSFNQPYSNQYNVPVDAEAVSNGTQTWTLESGCKDYEVRLDTFDGVTSNPNISNKITPSAWWRFMGGAGCTLADTQKPAPAMPPVNPNSTIKPIDSLKPMIRPTAPIAPAIVNPAVIAPKPVSPAVIVAPKPAADEPINNKKPVRKLNL